MGKRLIAKSKNFKVYETEVVFDNGQKANREYVSLFEDTLDAVMVAALTVDNELVYIEQFWPAMGKSGLIFPGGKVDKGEGVKEAAARELAEEVKLLPQKLDKLATVEILPKYLYGRTHLYIATDLKTTDDYVGDEIEGMKIHKIPARDILGMIECGLISDSRTVALSLLVLQYLKIS